MTNRPRTWRVGDHYGIHVYEVDPEPYGEDRPVATFHREEDARRAVTAFNAMEQLVASGAVYLKVPDLTLAPRTDTLPSEQQSDGPDPRD